MIELITWYLKNTKETLLKFQENNIYIYIYIYIFFFFELTSLDYYTAEILVEIWWNRYIKKNYLKISNVS
jgi:hypothetical protein